MLERELFRHLLRQASIAMAVIWTLKRGMVSSEAMCQTFRGLCLVSCIT